MNKNREDVITFVEATGSRERDFDMSPMASPGDVIIFSNLLWHGLDTPVIHRALVRACIEVVQNGSGWDGSERN